MEDLKRRIKILVPEEKHEEVDKVFCDWISELKVHKILNEEEPRKETGPQEQAPPQQENLLRKQVKELKEQIENFQEKMKTYKGSAAATIDMALTDVREEIRKVREGILKIKTNLENIDDEGKTEENLELLEKLDEVKQFLEKLK